MANFVNVKGVRINLDAIAEVKSGRPGGGPGGEIVYVGGSNRYMEPDFFDELLKFIDKKLM